MGDLRDSDPAETAQTGCCSSGGNDFEDVAGDKGQDGESEDGYGGLVRNDGEPGCSAEEDDQAAGRGREEGGGESAGRDAAAQRCGEGGGERIGEQIAACGSDEVEESGGAVRAEDGQTDCTFGQIEKEGGCGGGRREEQAEEENSEGLQRERDRREPERDGDVRADGHEEAAENDSQGAGDRAAKEGGPGARQSWRCSGSVVHRHRVQGTGFSV